MNFGMEREERLSRDSFAGLDIIIQSMKIHALYKNEKALRETHKALKSTIAIITHFIEDKSDKFTEEEYTQLRDDLDYFELLGDALLAEVEKKVAG